MNPGMLLREAELVSHTLPTTAGTASQGFTFRMVLSPSRRGVFQVVGLINSPLLRKIEVQVSQGQRAWRGGGKAATPAQEGYLHRPSFCSGRKPSLRSELLVSNPY